MKFNNYWFCLFLMCASCASPSSEKENTEEKGWVGKLGFHSGGDDYLIILGDSIRQVIPRFPLLISSNTDQLSKATFDLGASDSSHYQLEVFWPQEIVSKINLDVFPKDSTQAKIMFTELSEYYNSNLGKGSKAKDYAVWYTSSKDGVDVEISLLDESQNYGKPYLSIIYFLEEGIAD